MKGGLPPDLPHTFIQEEVHRAIRGSQQSTLLNWFCRQSALITLTYETSPSPQHILDGLPGRHGTQTKLGFISGCKVDCFADLENLCAQPGLMRTTGDGWMVGLGDPVGLFQTSWFYSMILWTFCMHDYEQWCLHTGTDVNEVLAR